MNENENENEQQFREWVEEEVEVEIEEVPSRCDIDEYDYANNFFYNNDANYGRTLSNKLYTNSFNLSGIENLPSLSKFVGTISENIEVAKSSWSSENISS